MPAEEKVIKDFERWEGILDKLGEWVDRIYYDPEITVFSNKPQVSYLRTACDFLSENIKLLKNDYIRRKT